MSESDLVLWEESRRWWGASLNRSPLVGEGTEFPDKVSVLDSTLREGDETAGIDLSVETKIELASKIVAVGISQLEVGYAGIFAKHADVVKALLKEDISCQIVSHARTYAQESEWKGEIERNIQLGVDILTFVGFASNAGLASTPWLSMDAVPDRIAACVDYAKGQGAIVSFGLADLVRTPLASVLACYQSALKAGAERLYVYDGVGAATPETISFLTRLLRFIGGRGTEIGVHVHNTFGLATALALAAIGTGASIVDAVPLGLGDGAGITATEEIVASLEVLYGISTGIDLAKLGDLCDHVSRSFNIAIPPNKSLVGENQFVHSIDSHISAILQGRWDLWEVMHPEALGRSRSIQFAPSRLRPGRSGALYIKAQQLGLDPEPVQMNDILKRASEVASQKGWASELDIERVVLEVMGHDHAGRDKT